jgi:hypothetical protein
MKRDLRPKPIVPLIINVEQLAERLYTEAETIIRLSTSVPFAKAPEEERSRYLALATSLLEKYEEKSPPPFATRFETPRRKGSENATLELLSHLQNKIAAEHPDLPKAVTDSFAKSLLITLKDKEFAQKLTQINKEILEFESQRRKLIAHQSLNTSQVTQWMSTLREHETTDYKIMRFIEKTEKRISENLTTDTERHLRNVGLKPIAYQQKITHTRPPRHSEIQDIPESQVPLVEELTKQIQKSTTIPKNRLLAKIKHLLMGAPSHLTPKTGPTPKEILREASHQNIKKGRAQITKATHSLENPFPHPSLPKPKALEI